MIEWIALFLFIVFVIWVRIKKRGYFWKDKKGNHLSFKQFMGRWKDGVEGITPLQQTRTSLWGFSLIFIGIFWGIVVTILNHLWYLVLIFVGSTPITAMQFVSTLQKYWAQKKVQEALKELK